MKANIVCQFIDLFFRIFNQNDINDFLKIMQILNDCNKYDIMPINDLFHLLLFSQINNVLNMWNTFDPNPLL